MFHLMTHAFFKALMFMAAGSVIAAMAGVQDIDRMSGLRRAMPFTFAAFLIAALALGAFPGMSGYFSKDEILAFAAERGGGYWILYAVGHARALMTAFYAFRMIFRVFWRRAERGGARARAAATSPTPSRSTRRPASPRTPTSASPGPEHHIAERERGDGGADGDPGGARRSSPAWSRSPASTHVIENFLDPTFADSRFADVDVVDAASTCSRWSSARPASLAGIGLAYVHLRAPARHDASRLAARFRRLHGFLVAQVVLRRGSTTSLIVRPMRRSGACASNVFERVVIDGMASGDGARGARRQLGRARRAVRACCATTRCC